MNIVKFIENRFQELRAVEFEKEQKQEYSISVASETMALNQTLSTLRWFMKWAFIPKVVGHYFMTCLGFARKPEPVLTNKLKAEKQKDLEAKAKKVGMLQKIQKEAEVTTVQ